MKEEFKIGFLGSATKEMAEWAEQWTDHATRICVPFAGSGKIIHAMSGKGKTVESWDTQIVSRSMVEGVFAAPKLLTAMKDGPRYKKGHMYETRPFTDIDGPSAGLVDYIGAHGSLADKVAIASAVARNTSMGRFDAWSGDARKLWKKFMDTRTYLADFVNRPGTFVHHEANVYEVFPQGPYDVLQVDPPKIVSSTDVYSVKYKDLNIALGGKIHELPKWTKRDYIVLMRRLFEIEADVILFMYTSEVQPTVDEMRRVLADYGTEVDFQRFLHRSRYDYGIAVRKGKRA